MVSHSDILGWLGIASLHGAALPTILSLANNPGAIAPPMSLIIMVWLGLLLLGFKALLEHDKFWSFANMTGFFLYSTILALTLGN
jgi:hypothetical protein|tara:strand:+ start:4854 stop:5108 length:255 start_codon:yes stop_codon:yes gene_type:complete